MLDELKLNLPVVLRVTSSGIVILPAEAVVMAATEFEVLPVLSCSVVAPAVLELKVMV